jgi:membrane protease YdiL (CAAX protease family)
MTSASLKKFIGTDRIEELLRKFSDQSTKQVQIQVNTIGLMIALGISLMPIASHFLEPYTDKIDITTVFIGVATVLSILFRVRHKIPFLSVTNWRQSLSLTHTAFAIGAVPTAFVLLFSPESLLPPPQILNSNNQNGLIAEQVWQVILQIALWAGLTEEFIYRGLLISAIRRSNFFGFGQLRKDQAAVIISAIVFGFSHYMLWGLPASLTLTGLGIGFGIAYIAIGELVLPLIVYHVIFDALSLSFAFLAYKI